jgi:hypothetical protein
VSLGSVTYKACLSFAPLSYWQAALGCSFPMEAKRALQDMSPSTQARVRGIMALTEHRILLVLGAPVNRCKRR